MLCHLFILFILVYRYLFYLYVYIEKSQRDEDRLTYEHRTMLKDMEEDLRERDDRIEELEETYEVQIQVSGFSVLGIQGLY